MQNYVQKGDVLTFTAAANIVAGQVVRVGNLLGVAPSDVASGAEGELNLTGVFTVPKVSAAVITIGQTLSWDASAAAFDDNAAVAATGDITGAAAVAWESAGDAVTTIKVKFTGVPGTLTA